MADWDQVVKYWLRDVPYIWTPPRKSNRKGWRDGKRIYLIPKNTLRKIPRGQGASLVDNPACDKDVGDYFMLTTLLLTPFYTTDRIRVNGHPVYFPKGLQQDIPVTAIYNYLGLPIPSSTLLKNWWKHLIIDERPPNTHIVIPSHSSRSSPLRYSKGRSLFILFWYLRYIGKVPGVCLALATTIVNPKYASQYNDLMSLKIKFMDKSFRRIYIENTQVQKREFQEIIHACLAIDRIRYILIPISLKYGWRGVGHANLLIADKETKAIYIFDPWGMTQYNESIKGVAYLIDQLGMTEGYEWRIVPSIQLCPRKAFQQLEKIGWGRETIEGDYGGFCAIWTLWLMDVLLNNPKEDYSKIVYKALQTLSMKEPDFRKFIRGYAKAVEDLGREMKTELELEFASPSKEEPRLSELDNIRIGRYSESIRSSYLQHL